MAAESEADRQVRTATTPCVRCCLHLFHASLLRSLSLTLLLSPSLSVSQRVCARDIGRH